jgi:N-methylhydantoinase B
MAGSGGYGDPLERDPQAVATDVLQEKISVAHAAAEYGVVVDSGTSELDAEATAAMRSRMGGAQ